MAEFRPKRAVSGLRWQISGLRGQISELKGPISGLGGLIGGQTDRRTDGWTNISLPVFYRTVSLLGPLPKSADSRPARAEFGL